MRGVRRSGPVSTLEEDLQLLEIKVKQLKLDYEQYFSGSRPREPSQLRGEIQKAIIMYSSTPIKNTALRFKFSSINSRFQAFKRQWDVILRRIAEGTYERHVFKANLHDRYREQKSESPAAAPGASRSAEGPDLFEAYREAARSCGQNVSNLTPEKLQSVLRRQEAQLKERLGCEKVKFRVEVQDGKVKLKASAVRS
jgi:hypothetical protein